MNVARMTAMVCAVAAGALCGCRMPGRPEAGPEVPRPQAVMAFAPLYAQNCAGCHGADGSHGAATDLANPEYEAIVDDDTLRSAISNGEKGTLMPGFGVKSGGILTDAQVEALVRGMRTQWGKPDALGGVSAPAYRASGAGDTSRGQTVYAQACARCHGATADEVGPAGSILDESFLALVNDQTLRTTMIAGRPDIGHPDWRGTMPGRPMTDAEITDVTAWLLAQKPARPGRPYPGTQLPASQNGTH